MIITKMVQIVPTYFDVWRFFPMPLDFLLCVKVGLQQPSFKQVSIFWKMDYRKRLGF